MPITLDTSAVKAYSDNFKRGDWLGNAINTALDVVDAALVVPHDTGQMESAFANRTPATGAGLERSGGIGNLAMVGDPLQPAPKDTISAFMKWYREEYGRA